MRVSVAARGVLPAAALLATSLRGAPNAPVDAAHPAAIRLYVDDDDDDDDGVEDRSSPTPWTAHDVYWIDSGKPMRLESLSGGAVRVFSDRGSLSAHAPALPKVGLQGIAAGTSTITLGTVRFDVVVCELVARESTGGHVNLATSHASLSRTLPPDLATDADGKTDLDAITWQARCPRGFLPAVLSVTSLDANGEIGRAHV